MGLRTVERSAIHGICHPKQILTDGVRFTMIPKNTLSPSGDGNGEDWNGENRTVGEEIEPEASMVVITIV